MIRPLTPRLSEYLEEFKRLQKLKGFPPTKTELANAMGVAENSATEAVRRLARRGLLRVVQPATHWRRFAWVEPKEAKLEQWARKAFLFLKKCNRIDLTSELQSILSE